MISYLEYRCPVCGEKFNEQDDIVVCPDCGAPHHRDCWKEEGACWYRARHQDGEVWREELRVAPAASEAAPEQPESAQTQQQPPHQALRICPRCGMPNAPTAHYCQNCSQQLQTDPEKDGQVGANGVPFPPYGFVVNPFLNATPSTTIEDIPIQDVSVYVGKNAMYYIPQFDRIQQTGRGRFHFSAFLFHGIWMLYRKQYKMGAIVLAIVFALTALAAFFQYQFSLPVAEALFATAGIDLSSGMITSLTSAQQLALLDAWSGLSAREVLLVLLPTLVEGLLLIVYLVVGFKANKWYYKQSLRRIREIKKAADSNEKLRAELSSRGGVNTPLTISIMVCAMLVSQYLEQIVYLLLR